MTKRILVSVLGFLGVILATVGVTYAFFSYSRTGTKTYKITSGQITFLYTESSQGISLNDAMPMTDAQGMAQTNYFDFEVTSKTGSTVEIPYYITARRAADSETGLDSYVKLYLTRVTGEAPNEVETPIEIKTGQTIATFTELNGYTNSLLNIPQYEKTLYNTLVPSSSNYGVKYRLRAWISSNANYIVQTPVAAHCSDPQFDNQTECLEEKYVWDNGVCSNDTYLTEEACESASVNTWIPADVISSYPFNGKSYNIKVNVYGSGSAVVPPITNPDITSVVVGEATATLSDTAHFNAEACIPQGSATTDVAITVTPKTIGATYTIGGTSAQSYTIQEGVNNFEIAVTNPGASSANTYYLAVTATTCSE